MRGLVPAWGFPGQLRPRPVGRRGLSHQRLGPTMTKRPTKAEANRGVARAVQNEQNNETLHRWGRGDQRGTRALRLKLGPRPARRAEQDLHRLGKNKTLKAHAGRSDSRHDHSRPLGTWGRWAWPPFLHLLPGGTSSMVLPPCLLSAAAPCASAAPASGSPGGLLVHATREPARAWNALRARWAPGRWRPPGSAALFPGRPP